MWAATKNANRDAPSWERQSAWHAHDNVHHLAILPSSHCGCGSGPRPDRFVPMDPDAPAHGLQLEDDDAEKVTPTQP